MGLDGDGCARVCVCLRVYVSSFEKFQLISIIETKVYISSSSIVFQAQIRGFHRNTLEFQSFKSLFLRQ